MTVTLDLPDELVKSVMEFTHTDSQSDGIRVGLENLVRKNADEKFAERFGGVENFDIDEASKYVDSSELVNYFGKLDLRKDIDLDALRGRNNANW
ncbi:MAG: hypothetical protein FWF51_09995 [Chitinivibrionia bacterium]|nr:hypothetical protein [Chitinivibrionia bacterium]